MAQMDEGIAKALEYMRYQGAKGFDDLLALMQRTADDWARALEGWSDGEAEFKPGEEWSAKEVLAHVLHSNRGVNQQIAEMAGVESPRESPRVTGMGQSSEEYERMSVDELRAGIAEAFGENQTLVKSLESSDKLDQTFPHPFFGQLNLKEWVAFQRVHAMDHMQQLDKIKADPAYPGE